MRFVPKHPTRWTISLRAVRRGSARRPFQPLRQEKATNGPKNSTLKKQGIKATVLGQIVGADEAIAALAEKYGVSGGKAALIKKAAESDPNLDKTELSKLDIGALGVLAQNGKAEASASISVTGDSGAGGYVSADAAAKSACAKANVSLGSAASAEVAAEVSGGTLVYKVTVKAGASINVDPGTGINGQSILDRVHSDAQSVIDSLQQRIRSGLNQTN